MLEQAQKEKLVLADKMRAIENEKTDMEFDYQWLCDKVCLFEISSFRWQRTKLGKGLQDRGRFFTSKDWEKL